MLNPTTQNLGHPLHHGRTGAGSNLLVDQFQANEKSDDVLIWLGLWEQQVPASESMYKPLAQKEVPVVDLHLQMRPDKLTQLPVEQSHFPSEFGFGRSLLTKSALGQHLFDKSGSYLIQASV